MRAIKLSWKLARVLRDFVDGGERRNHAQLLAALDAALKPKRAVTAARKVRTRKRQTRKERVAELRELVFDRANSVCEVPRCSADATDLEHFWGGSNRRAMESLEGCWALCRPHHNQKGRCEPSREYWLAAFLAHSELYGYRSEPQHRAQAELDALHIQEGRSTP